MLELPSAPNTLGHASDHGAKVAQQCNANLGFKQDDTMFEGCPRKVSKRAKQIKYLDIQIKEAQENVMVRKLRCSKFMRKAIENAAVHNGNRSDKKDNDMTSGDWEREGMPI